MLIFFLTLESLNAEIYASFDTFALRCHNNRLPCLLLYSPEYSLQMHVRAVQRMTMFRLSIVTDVFTFSKQRAIQLLFAPENLSCFLLTARKGAPETRFKCEPLSYKRRDAQT